MCNPEHRKQKEPADRRGSSAWLEGASGESGAGGAVRKVGSVRLWGRATLSQVGRQEREWSWQRDWL